LIESLLRYAESFFPWGYPICEGPTPWPVALARGTIYGPPTEGGSESVVDA